MGALVAPVSVRREQIHDHRFQISGNPRYKGRGPGDIRALDLGEDLGLGPPLIKSAPGEQLPEHDAEAEEI